MGLVIDSYGLTDVGRLRANNEDSWRAVADLGLYIVADGMGGQAAGELASRIVVEMLPGMVRRQLGELLGRDLPRRRTQHLLCRAISLLSSQLRGHTKDRPGLAGMGSTVVSALIHDWQLVVVYMGDSRAYLLRNGQLKRLTLDHTLTELLVKSGQLSEAKARRHASHHRLTRSVGMEGIPRPQSRWLKLHAGDQLLLCTDGLTNMLDDEPLRDLLLQGGPLESQAQRLVAAANEAGGLDNITVLLLRASAKS